METNTELRVQNPLLPAGFNKDTNVMTNSSRIPSNSHLSPTGCDAKNDAGISVYF